MTGLTIDVIKVFTLGAISFGLSIWLTPILTHFLYKHQLWRKDIRTKSIDNKDLHYFKKYHSERETHVPRFGGLLVWTGVLFLAVIFYLLSFTDIWWLEKLNFLSRNQVWLPLFALVFASLVGLLDDILQVGKKGHALNKYIGGGLKIQYRITLVALIGGIGGWWFYAKLGDASIHIPGNGDLFLGLWYIPFFVLVMLATYSGGVIDGIDGLSGGAFATMFGAYGIIALFQSQIDLAAFCFALVGAILAFLWFNIPPARFYMGETGILGLCCALTVVAFLTNSVLVLPIIGFLLVVEAGSVIVQLLSKKIFGRKVFLAAPIHHHFEAKGWPGYKIAMRFWVIGVVMAIIGVTIRLLG